MSAEIIAFPIEREERGLPPGKKHAFAPGIGSSPRTKHPVGNMTCPKAASCRLVRKSGATIFWPYVTVLSAEFSCRLPRI